MLENPEQAALLRPAKRSKYKAKSITIDGIRFASRAEGARYCELKLEEKNGLICNLELQPIFYLVTINIKYVADFRYQETETAKIIVEDVKGVETPVFRLKRKLYESFPDYPELRIVKMSGRRVGIALSVYGSI